MTIKTNFPFLSLLLPCYLRLRCIYVTLSKRSKTWSTYFYRCLLTYTSVRVRRGYVQTLATFYRHIALITLNHPSAVKREWVPVSVFHIFFAGIPPLRLISTKLLRAAQTIRALYGTVTPPGALVRDAILDRYLCGLLAHSVFRQRMMQNKGDNLTLNQISRTTFQDLLLPTITLITMDSERPLPIIVTRLRRLFQM